MSPTFFFVDMVGIRHNTFAAPSFYQSFEQEPSTSSNKSISITTGRAVLCSSWALHLVAWISKFSLFDSVHK